MARIDWALLCDLAFFDRQDRLCIVGVVQRLPTPELPLAISQMMLVAHLTDIEPVDEVEVSVTVVTPSGLINVPKSADCLDVELSQEYILVTLRDVPLKEQGVFRFQVGLTGQPAASVDVQVIAPAALARAGVH